MPRKRWRKGRERLSGSQEWCCRWSEKPGLPHNAVSVTFNAMNGSSEHNQTIERAVAPRQGKRDRHRDGDHLRAEQQYQNNAAKPMSSATRRVDPAVMKVCRRAARIATK
jgi:hypothetical protein